MNKIDSPVLQGEMISAGVTAKPVSSKNPVEAAKQFEALLVQEMLKSMWQTIPEGGLISGSNEEQQYRDMFNEQLAMTIASGKGVGIKEVIQKDIEKIDKKA
jgi:flagellar protein FlgJ